MKPSSPVLQSARLLEQLRECFLCNYYSLNKEKYYFYWVLFSFVAQAVVALLAGIVKPVSVCTLRMSEAIFVGRAPQPGHSRRCVSVEARPGCGARQTKTFAELWHPPNLNIL